VCVGCVKCWLTLNYHIEYESQNYGKLWHDHDVECDLVNFIKEEAKVRRRIQHVTDRNRVDQMYLCLVLRVFDQEMAVPEPCTISRANVHVTSLNCDCRDISWIMLLYCLISSKRFEAVVVVVVVSIWC
jgi:hypothetical protein